MHSLVKSNPNVFAVIVSYNPEPDKLGALLRSIAHQVQGIVVVDNGSSTETITWLREQQRLIPFELRLLGENKGVAAAQNEGINYAGSADADFVLILDHDSQPMPEMVKLLLKAYLTLQSAGVSVGAVAPQYSETPAGLPSGFVRLGWFGCKRDIPSLEQKIVEADFVISSGSLIPVGVLDEIGTMDESLFIDYVDTEWCIRAQSKGYRLFTVPAARMLHTLGDKRMFIWFLRWRNIAFHAPFRYYYMLRNSCLLQRRSYVSYMWRLRLFFRSAKVFVFFGLFAPKRGQSLRMMCKGIWHGLKGVTGPMPGA